MLSVTEGSSAVCFVLYLRSLSTYDIVITTYSLVAKEIPTKKQEGDVPGANLSTEVRLGLLGKGGRSPASLNLSLVTALGVAEAPASEVGNVLVGPPVEMKSALSLFYST